MLNTRKGRRLGVILCRDPQKMRDRADPHGNLGKGFSRQRERLGQRCWKTGMSGGSEP